MTNTTSLLIKELSDAYPDKKFATVVKIEEGTLRPWTMITVNGKATAYGFYLDHVSNMIANGHTTETFWVNKYLENNGKYFRSII